VTRRPKMNIYTPFYKLSRSFLSFYPLWSTRARIIPRLRLYKDRKAEPFLLSFLNSVYAHSVPLRRERYEQVLSDCVSRLHREAERSRNATLKTAKKVLSMYGWVCFSTITQSRLAVVNVLSLSMPCIPKVPCIISYLSHAFQLVRCFTLKVFFFQIPLFFILFFATSKCQFELDEAVSFVKRKRYKSEVPL